MKHPLSTISSIGYIAWGIYGMVESTHFAQFMSYLFMVGLGVASGGYHWTENKWWQRFDIVMIFATFFGMLANQVSLYAGNDVFFVIVFSGLAVLVAYTYERWDHEDIFLLGVINVALIWERSIWQFTVTLVLYLTGLLIGRYAERFRKNTTEYDKPHAVWHVDTSTALFLTGL